MKRLLLATAFLFISFLYITPPTSHAQTVYEWSCDFNLMSSDGSWLPYQTGGYDYALYSAGNGWRRPSSSQVQARFVFVSPIITATVSKISVEYSIQTHVIGSGGSVRIAYGSQVTADAVWATIYNAGATLVNWTSTGTYTLSAKRIHLSHVNATATNGTAFPTTLYAKRVLLEGNGTKPSLSQCVQNIVPQPQLTAPITPGSISATYDPIGDTAQGMYWSAPGNVFVSAMLDGTVSDISMPSCSELYPYISNTPLVCSFDFNGVNIIPNSNDQYRVVTINHTSGYKIKQLIKASDVFVSVGQTVNANCPLGFAFDVSPLSSGKYTHNWLIDEVGSKVQYTGTYTPATDSPYCGAPTTEVSQCLGDATFQQGQWQSSGSVTIDELGARLGAGASITTQMSLPSGAYTELKVSGGVSSGSGTLFVQLGTTTQTFTLPTNVLLSEAVRTPDIGTFYTVKLTNVGSTTIRVSYACVRVTRDGGGTPIDPPPTYITTQNCVLSNSNFASLGTGWSKSDTFQTVTFSNSQAHVPFGEFIYQSITLPVGTYTLTLRVSLDYSTETLAFSSDSVSLLYAFPNLTPTVNVGTVSVSEMRSNNLKELSVQISVLTATTGNFRIFAQSATTVATGVAISSACITGGGITSLGTCTTIPTPFGTGVGEWTTWLWANFAKFFDCQLMPTLLDMSNVISRQFVMLGWSIRYQLAQGELWSQWLGAKLLPWLAGYMSNMNGGTVTVEATCNNIFCVLLESLRVIESLVDVFRQLLDLVGQVVGSVLNLANTFINQVLALFNNAQLFFTTITNAYQTATPATIPILPTCSNPKSSGFCIVSWMLENTILSGTGALLFPLLMSFASILWLLWGVKTIKATITESGGLL